MRRQGEIAQNGKANLGNAGGNCLTILSELTHVFLILGKQGQGPLPSPDLQRKKIFLCVENVEKTEFMLTN